MRLVPREEAGDAAAAVDHGLRLAPRRGLGLVSQAGNVDATLDRAHEARVEIQGLPEQRLEFGNCGTLRRALLGPEPLVALTREAVADAGDHDARAECQ